MVASASAHGAVIFKLGNALARCSAEIDRGDRQLAARGVPLSVVRRISVDDRSQSLLERFAQ